MYELHQSIVVHTDDVKSVRGPARLDGKFLPQGSTKDSYEDDFILSASRDTTACLFTRDDPTQKFQLRTPFLGSTRYLSAAVYLPESDFAPSQVITGSLDSLIRTYDPRRGGEKTLQVIKEHHDNVCALDIWLPTHARTGNSPNSKAILASGSWDTTARIFAWGPQKEGTLPEDVSEEAKIEAEISRWRPLHLLKGHSKAVWGVKIFDANRVLTTCADGLVRLFDSGNLVKTFRGHEDVTRGIALLPKTISQSSPGEATAAAGATHEQETFFATASNDATIRIWSTEKEQAIRVLEGHNSLVYEVAVLDDERLVSSSEDGTARIWSLKDGQLLQTIWHHVTTVWTVTVIPKTDDIVTGCSDGSIRVFRNVGEGEQRVELSVEDQDEHDRFLRAAEEMRARIESTVSTEAVLSEGAQDSSPHNDEEVTIQIDVADDQDPLPLPVKRSDDPLAKAEEFVKAHNLPESYIERIADFINLMLPPTS